MSAAERTILVTGVAGYWGGRLAARLLDEGGARVIGVDVLPPDASLPGLDFVQADFGHELMAELLRQEAVDTVCHLDFRESERPSPETFDHNVLTAVRLFGACAEAGVEHIVWRSSTAVYGPSRDGPLYRDETAPLQGDGRSGSVRDWVEMERFTANFRRHTPQVGVTTLRLAHVVGPTAVTPMTRLLWEWLTPTLLGFDPLVQLLHEDDAVDALTQAALARPGGDFNVAAGDALPLTRLMALARTRPLPIFHPLAYWGAGWVNGRLLPLGLDQLRYPCLADLSRMSDELGFVPRHSAAATARQFGQLQGDRMRG